MPRPPRFVSFFLAALTKTERALALLAFSVVGVVIFVDVANRELMGPVSRVIGLDPIGSSLFWSQKIAPLALVVAAFTSIGISVGAGVQIVPRLGTGLLPAAWDPLIERIGFAVSGLIFGMAAVFAYLYVVSSLELGTLISGTRWSAWLFQAIAPIGFASASLRFFTFALWPTLAPNPARTD